MKTVNQVYLFIIILLSSILFPAYALPDLFPTPHIDNDIALVYQNTPAKEGKFRSENWGLDIMNSYFIDQYKRTSGPDGDKVTMTSEGFYRNVGSYSVTLEFKEKDNRLQQTRFTREVTDFSGETALSYKISFEGFRDIFPEDTYASEILAFLFRGLDMTPKSKFTFHWWSTESSAIRMYTKVKKPREITVPAGTFTCYPVEVYVDIAGFLDRGGYINKLVNPFMPDSILYFDVNHPHYFIYYEGPHGPPGSVESHIDLVKIVKGEQAIEEIRQKIKSPETYAGDGKLPNIFE